MRKTILAVTLVSLAGCATGPKMRQLSVGIPEAEVVRVMGAPDGRIVEGDVEALRWVNRLMSGWAWDRADYWVLLEGGRVTAYGPGEVRPDTSRRTLVFVPLGQ